MLRFYPQAFLSKHLPANLLKGRDAKFKCLTRIFPV